MSAKLLHNYSKGSIGKLAFGILMSMTLTLQCPFIPSAFAATDFDNNLEEAYQSMEKQDFQSAVTKLTDLDKQSPNNYFILINRGICYHELKQYDKALIDMDKALKADPVKPRGYLLRGLLLMDMNQPRKAALDFDFSSRLYKLMEDNEKSTQLRNQSIDAVITSPNQEAKDYLQKASDKWDEDKNKEEVINLLTKAIEKDPSYVSAYFNRALAYDITNNLDKAMADIEKAIQLDPDKANAYEERANIKRLQKKYKDAERDYAKAALLYELQNKPEQAKEARANQTFARTNSSHADAVKKFEESTDENNSKNYDKAIELLKEATKLDPNYASAFHNIGNALFNTGKYQEAVDNLSKAIQIDPERPLTYELRGQIYRKMKQYSKSVQDCKKAMQLYEQQGDYANLFYPKRQIIYAQAGAKGDQAEELYQKALTEQDAKNYEKCIELLNECIKLLPSNPSFYFQRGIIYRKLGKTLPAIEDYNKCIELDPDYTNAFYNRGIAYMSVGEKDKAKQDFAKSAFLSSKEANAADMEDALKQALATDK